LVQYWESPTAIKHGPGALEILAAEVRRIGGSKPLIVTDKGVISAGLLDKVTEVLNREALPYAVFDAVVGNPPAALVGEGTAAYVSHGCDCMVAVGGGSSMDTAKAIGVEVVHDGRILDYEFGRTEITKKIPPLVCVPTTSGTGSETTLWAVITDPDRKIKFNVGGTPLIAASVALIDPLLTVSMPPRLTAWTGMDALSHAIECYTCAYSQPVTDAVALLCIEYVGKYLRRAFANGEDLEARHKMCLAATLGGMAYGVDSAGAVHAMAQTFGGCYDVHHGYLTAVMLAPVMEFNWMGWPEKFARIAQALGENVYGLRVEEAAKLSYKAVYELARDLEIEPIRSTGMTQEDIPELARLAFEDPQTVGNPRIVDLDGYVRLYTRLYNEA